jgi:hypothetical protein
VRRGLHLTSAARGRLVNLIDGWDGACAAEEV